MVIPPTLIVELRARAPRALLTLTGALALAMVGAVKVAAAETATKAQPKTPPTEAGETLTIPTHNEQPTIKDLDKDKCFEVKEIVITGIALVKPEEIEKRVAPLAYRCVGNVLAKFIIAAINDAHSTRGYVTTQGYVRRQDIKKTKRLVINVVAGKIAKIVTHEHDDDETVAAAWKRTGEAKGPWSFLSGLSGLWGSLDIWLNRSQALSPAWFPNLKTWLAMPADPGDTLDIDAIQQGVDQLNRSPSQKTSAKLAPGADPGFSDVIIDAPRVQSFRLDAGYEINGGALNGVGTIADRARVDVAKDNLFGLNDNWSATFASGVESNEAHAALVVPIRWLTLSLNAGYSEYFSVISADAALFEQIGTLGGDASYVISRDRSQTTTIDASFNMRNVLRYIDLFELDPQNVSIARLGINQTRYFANAQLSYGVGYSQGLPVFDATRDPANASVEDAHAEFKKVDLSANYIQVFKPYGALKIDVIGQYSPTALFQEDQLTFGSVSTVRGFARAPGFADSGVYVRSEFSPYPPIDQLFGDRAKDLVFSYDALKAMQPYVFVDAGYGRDIANQQYVSRASFGGGLRYSLGRLNFDWSAAKPVYWSGDIINSKMGAFETYLNMTVTLF
jgi:hemolysin activation/secretion protein